MRLSDYLEASARRAARYFLNVRRLAGIALIGMAAYFIIFVLFGRLDVSGLLPPVARTFAWPRMPQFLTWHQTGPGGQEETVYTVPTRKITPQEMAQIEGTNAAPTVAHKN